MQASPEKPPTSHLKNLVIFLLAGAVIVLGGLHLLDFGEGQEPALDSENATETVEPAPLPEELVEPGDEPVSVTLTAVEPEFRRFLRIAFSRPLGEGLVGQSLDESPVAISPEKIGVWTWISPHLLQFDPIDPFQMNTDYWITLYPDQLISEGQVFEGDTEIRIQTGRFEVRGMDVYEDPSQSAPGRVVIKGEIEFSYNVDPRELLDHLHVYDPATGEEVEVFLTTSYRSRWLNFKTEPVEKFVEPRDLRITIGGGLTPTHTGASLGQEFVSHYPLVLDPNLQVISAVAETNEDQSSIEIRLSTPVIPEAAEEFIRVVPVVDYDISSSGNYLYLTGDFEPGVEYSLTVMAGLLAADGAQLQGNFLESVFMPDLYPYVAFENPGMFLSREGYQNLAIKSVNTDLIYLYIDRVYTNNLFTMLVEYGEWHLFREYTYDSAIGWRLGDRIVDEEIQVAGGHNQVEQTVVNAGEHIQPDEPGIYRIQVAEPNNQWEVAQRWVLITDLGIVAKQGEDDFLVWVSSFDDLSAKAGVDITILSDQNQLIAQGQTDEDGLFRVDGLVDVLEEHNAYVITAQMGNDFSFLLLNEFRIDTTGQDVGGIYLESDDYYAYIYGERDIYRPGETAEGLAVIRNAELNAPPSMPLRLVQRDPQGRDLGERVVTSDDQGLAEFAIDIPAYAPTGDYTLELMAAEEVIGSYRYKVEEFVPDRIKVEIAPEAASIASDQTLAFDVASRYFFGPPASAMRVETRVRLRAAPFAPEGYDGFIFGNPELAFEEEEIFFEEDQLDDEGLRAYSVDLPEGLTPPAAMEAVITTRVMERGGRGVAAMQPVQAHAYPYYPGLERLEKWGYGHGETIDFSYILVTPQGEEATAQPLLVEFYKDRWQTVLRSTPEGGFRYDSVRDSWMQHSLTLDSASSGEFSYTPPEFGSYRVVITDPATGASSQMSFYVGGYGYSPWAVANPASLELVPDQEEYMPGDTAHIQVRAPFSGKLLVTVEGQSVMDHYILDMEGNTADVAIPITDAYSPNAYVSAVLVRSASDVEPGAVGRASGSTPLFVDRSANKPEIRIFSPEEVRPETQLEVRIQSEPNAVITLAAVDEGILQLISQETPDPFSHFYAKRSLGVRGYDTFAWLFPEIPDLQGRSPEGGDAAMDRHRQFVRTESMRRVEPVAYWSGPIVTDENGEAVYTIDLPEFQGALRLMVVAINGRRFNSNHAVTRVRSPVVLTPTFPRFLSLDETVLIPVTLRNDTPTDGEFTVTMDVEGPVTVEQETLTMAVSQGTEELAYFTMQTGAAEGGVTCTVRAQGNEETAKAEVNLYSRAAFPFRSVVAQGDLQEPASEFPFASEGLFEEAGASREIYIARTPLVRFTRGLKWLLRYPYGCVEQTTSRVFPLLYIEDLASELDPDLFENRSASYLIQDGIRRLQTMQLSSGGFAMWRGGRTVYPWGTLYATHFLLEAKDAGYHVGDTVLENAVDYISDEMLVSKDAYSDSELNTLCYALYVMSKAGRNEHIGLMNSL
ncbi:MAG: alpha-2-macroglobulin family protein, partial [Desulfovibrio sp.]